MSPYITRCNFQEFAYWILKGIAQHLFLGALIYAMRDSFYCVGHALLGMYFCSLIPTRPFVAFFASTSELKQNEVRSAFKTSTIRLEMVTPACRFELQASSSKNSVFKAGHEPLFTCAEDTSFFFSSRSLPGPYLCHFLKPDASLMVSLLPILGDKGYWLTSISLKMPWAIYTWNSGEVHVRLDPSRHENNASGVKMQGMDWMCVPEGFDSTYKEMGETAYAIKARGQAAACMKGWMYKNMALLKATRSFFCLFQVLSFFMADNALPCIVILGNAFAIDVLHMYT